MKNWLVTRSRVVWFSLIGMVVILIACAGLLGLSLRWDRLAAQYPNSKQISSHSKYRLPFNYLWDDVYATEDPINLVYQWYSVRYELGAESRANGGCSLIEDRKTRLGVTRYIGVLVCEMGDERLIYVNRETALR